MLEKSGIQKVSIKTVFFTFLSLLCIFPLETVLGEFVVPPLPPTPVYDEVGFLTPDEKKLLEEKIWALESETKHQIGVAILKSLQGYTAAEVGVILGRQWGVGQESIDNGLLFVIMPVGESGQRDAWISVGYGLEGVMTDLVSSRVVDENLIPHFARGDNIGGFLSALERIGPLLKGEVVDLPRDTTQDAGVLVTMIFWLVWGSMFLGSALFEPSKAWWPGLTIGVIIGGLFMWFLTGTILMTVLGCVFSGSILGVIDWAFSTGKIKALNSRPGGGRWGGGFGSGGGGSWGGFGGGGFGGGGGGGKW